jgi:uncharacterized protein YjbJ (UPF0337 family)
MPEVRDRHVNPPRQKSNATRSHLIRSGFANRNRSPENQELIMDKDRVEGAAHQAKGSVKEAVGKMTGDKKTQASGASEKAAGKVQNTAGGVKDAAKDATSR